VEIGHGGFLALNGRVDDSTLGSDHCSVKQILFIEFIKLSNE